MTEDQIERTVERRINRIDAEYMQTACKWTRAEYEARINAVDAWAEEQYRLMRA
jgi:hypothetical protein